MKIIRIQLIAIAILLATLPAAPRADDASKAAGIKVEVTGFRNDNGKLGCSLFNSPEGFPRDGSKVFRHMWASPIKNGRGECFFVGVPAGDYAVTVFHDENGNGKLDTNIIGYPVEGYALLNGIRAVISRPRFSDAAFKVGDGDRRIALHIQY